MGTRTALECAFKAGLSFSAFPVAFRMKVYTYTVIFKVQSKFPSAYLGILRKQGIRGILARKIKICTLW
jgi:hypothetical protein